MITACIFDLDGVLVDTAHYHFIAWKRLAKEFEYDLTEAVNERLKGVSRLHSLEIILKEAGATFSEAEKLEMANRKNVWFTEFVNAMQPEELYPGVTDLFEKLKADTIKIALGSSSKNAQTILRKLKIQQYFDSVVDGTMIVNSKPDPEIFLLAAQKLGVDPVQCVVFEDAEAGVEAALAANMKCVGIGQREQLGKANQVVKSIGDFNYHHLQNL